MCVHSFTFARYSVSLWNAFDICAFFEFAKKFRTVTFYNKKLKQRLLISEINAEKLKYHVVWRFLSIRNAKLEKVLPRVPCRKIETFLSKGLEGGRRLYCSPMTCIITVRFRG
jgi:hypothetical protein